ncbi:type II toxin-antitoxin system RatA family toxin [Laribacter hongkongensis]|uniref:Oligoketide cyclase/lipid transport protein n=1 Tax=Laribacter hongkongensis (strain HLHK9) TaxID=557598 RepID=C1D4H8_LARHH|nr:type II toxin-antitoxin system RatA family toxin [Laribacter hongkongensis]ACO73772.1 Oligoketide cyclase/lipid transport protein [Laribacter hongkongensis HLHK9]MCG9032444.1 type II toxin-antitoxin system RatA family toxin [Laribacter hongkongensis]MCG9092150.1 type II toxin-antitoxin system RatA family toxin [Laribacter hongkongensis]MCG9114455.1 type II toxin-antitoxin system RatA family toxin [Laribacter hongkongensis]MCG9125503.1 type II toxin-antitoxin system RatA family toxin [Lariba
MSVIEKTVLVAHTPVQMFDLVNDVARYPKFLPWCSQTEEVEGDDTYMVARLHIDYLKIRQHFTTRNQLVPGELIDMQLVDGPFRQLAGSWRFYPLGEFGCKIVFELRYDFSSRLLETVIGPVFGRIMTSLVDAFIEEADRVYGDD